ncbi:DUF3710 domain-containing protein [Rhodococcus sp. MEB064]|uniref:DUF3710 domain-containing protein n=1 Tax=Rhodococcus sp. MEB064 TaxID=1587522 RepID=UPI0005ACC0E4|nr:DUF3710 domain-containing protein [Rhodococcus sp. MEB064]KIQ20711.1 hypothetical protein RU01_01265 [Rhodococcus sp. MEB064]
MFGRKKKDADLPADETTVAEVADIDEVDELDEVDGSAGDGSGPWSLEDLDDDRAKAAASRLDLGSVLLPLPAGGQLQVEMTQAGAPQAVHVVTPNGRITVAAFAAPKSPGQWRDVATELADTLRRDNANVSIETGPWGREVVGSTAGGDLRFIGVDGYRWMIRGVATGPAGSVDASSPLVQEARAVIAGTIVDRGTDPHPVRTPLPITLPEALAQQLAAAQQQQMAAAQAQAAQSAPAPAQPTPAQQSPAPVADPEDDVRRRRGPGGSAMQQLD